MRIILLIIFLISAALFANSNSWAESGNNTVPTLTQVEPTGRPPEKSNKMGESFSERTTHALFLSRYEAGVSGATSIQSYHILLGLVRADLTMIMALLPEPSSDIRPLVRRKIQQRVAPGAGTNPAKGSIPLAAESQRILRSSLAIAGALREPVVETKHLLLAIMWEEPSVAAQVLSELGLKLDKLYSRFNFPASLSEVRLRLKAQGVQRQLFFPLGDNYLFRIA